MKRIRSERGAISSTLLIAIVVAVAIVIVLFFVLRDQGKDDKPDTPGIIAPQVVLGG